MSTKPAPKRTRRHHGSAPESRLTSKVCTVRLSPVVRAGLERLAEEWGVSRSAAVTRLVAEKAGITDTSPPPPPNRRPKAA